jgi:hypothetical protein
VAIKIKNQKYYLLTEVTLEPPVDSQELDKLMQKMKANGKVVIPYNGGECPGVNLEQKIRMSDQVSEKVRVLMNIDDQNTAL